MWRGSRPGFRRLAVFGLVVAGAAAFALFLIGAISGGSKAADEYGRISLPGSGTLELPEGDVALFYEERVTLPENSSLDPPEGLRVRARRETTIRSKKTTRSAINLDGRSMTQFGKLEVPAAGRYRVRVRSKAPGGNTPAVTFGTGLGKVMGEAALRSGLIIAGGGALALLLLLLGRIGYDPGPVIRPVAPSAPAPPTGPSPWDAEPEPKENDGDVAAALSDLQMRRSAGLISEEEYEAERKRILASL